ncbi:MAG: 6-bladed beta-propeller [Bacteroidales bacterium]|nr:6-bladed beta-propeller [Bacteroidales bacterium]
MKQIRLNLFLSASIILVLISSCKIFQTTTIPEKVIVFPSAPDTARIQFLTSIGNSFDIEGRQSKFKSFVLGKEESKTIKNAFGVDIRFGKIYVCDIGIKGLEIIDLNKKTFDYFLPEGNGKLVIPVNCHVDEKGYLYVADSGRKEIVVFDVNGNFVNAFGASESFKPLDVFVSDNKIWVANMKNHTIDVFQNDTSYKFLFSFPDAKKGDDAFLYQPRNVFVTNNNVFVSDFGSFNVKKFSKEGNYLSTIGAQGLKPGQFARPKGIAVDNEDNLYVIDAAFANAQIFNKDNHVLMFFGNPAGGQSGKGYMYMPAGIDINYEDVHFFEKFTDPKFKLKYIILVTNQYGPYKLNIYGRVELKE